MGIPDKVADKGLSAAGLERKPNEKVTPAPQQQQPVQQQQQQQYVQQPQQTQPQYANRQQQPMVQQQQVVVQQPVYVPAYQGNPNAGKPGVMDKAIRGAVVNAVVGEVVGEASNIIDMDPYNRYVSEKEQLICCSACCYHVTFWCRPDKYCDSDSCGCKGTNQVLCCTCAWCCSFSNKPFADCVSCGNDTTPIPGQPANMCCYMACAPCACGCQKEINTCVTWQNQFCCLVDQIAFPPTAENPVALAFCGAVLCPFNRWCCIPTRLVDIQPPSVYRIKGYSNVIMSGPAQQVMGR